MPTCVATRWKNVGCTHDGRVYFKTQDFLTKGYVGMGGYLRANVCHSGRSVHRIIAETLGHNPAPEVFDVVHHKNNDKYLNASSNLQWVNTQLNTMMRKDAKGCYFNRKRLKWEAKGTAEGVVYHLGWFPDYRTGHQTYLEWRKKKFKAILPRIVRHARKKKKRTCRFIFLG